MTDQGSILIHEAEGRSYDNRAYIKGLIQCLIDDEEISNDHAEGLEEFLKIKKYWLYEIQIWIKWCSCWNHDVHKGII